MTLEQASKDLFICDPFCGFILMNLDTVYTDTVSTLGVSLSTSKLSYTLFINRAFWDSLKDSEQLEVLKHEILHICFFHCTDIFNFKDHETANLAADAEVNQYLSYRNLPKGAVNIFNIFPTASRKAGMKYYYDLLSSNNGSSSDFGLNSGTADSSDNCPNNSSGNVGTLIDDHTLWEKLSKLTESEKEILKGEIDSILENALNSSKGRGTVPSSVVEYLSKLKDKKPEINWAPIFRRMVGTSEKYYLKSSRKRESKRFKDSAGFRKIHKASALVAIDTSGSVSVEDLQRFMLEIDHLHKRGVDVDLIEFDAKIQGVTPYSKFNYRVHGRGGTDYKPVFDYYNNVDRKHNILVLFTDGQCPIDNIGTNKPVVWVLTENSENISEKFSGKVVALSR